MQADDEIVMPQDDHYIISWETEFDDFPPAPNVNNPPDDSTPNSDRPDAIITDLDLRSTRWQADTDAANTEPLRRDVNDADLKSTRRQQKTDSEMDETTSKSPSEARNFDFLNSRGEDTIVPDFLDSENDEMVVGNESPRGGKYNLRPNPTPNFTDEYRY